MFLGKCVTVKALVRAQESQNFQALDSGILDILALLPGPDQQMLGVHAPSAFQDSKQSQNEWGKMLQLLQMLVFKLSSFSPKNVQLTLSTC